jgi:hypothetical protein
MRRRIGSAPAGSSSNFDVFRGAPKVAPIRRKSFPNIVRAPGFLHSVRLAKRSLVLDKIQRMYKTSETRRIVATELVDFLAKSPKATQEDIFASVFSKLKGKVPKVEHAFELKGKKSVALKEFSRGVVVAVYNDLIGRSGVIKKSKIN